MKKTSWLIAGLCLIAVILAIGIRGEIESVENRGEEGPAAKLTIHYFWTITCPYCRQQNIFWEDFTRRYPEVELKKYSIDSAANSRLLLQMARAAGAERYAGSVPMTFVGDRYFLGFDGPEGVGREIEAAVIAALAELEVEPEPLVDQ
jgi:hypothetical protein